MRLARLLRHRGLDTAFRAAKRPPKEFNAVPYNNPPFGLAPFCEAELFWNSDDPWEKILMRARMRALPER